MRFNSDVRMTAADKNDSGMSSNKNGKKKRRLGRWTVKEHERFLEALRIYGKDWTMIQRHVKTRQVTNIRAHAQKFLLKLVKVVEQKEKMSSSNENSMPSSSGDPETDMNTNTAQFFYDILSKKMHKLYSKQLKQAEKEQVKPGGCNENGH